MKSIKSSKWHSPNKHILRIVLLASVAIIVVYLWSGSIPTRAALGFVQVQNNHSTTAAASISVNITTTAGNLLVAFVREGSNNTATFTVTDSAGQSWTQTASGYCSANASNRCGMFYMANSAAVTSVTANYSASVSPISIMVYEVSGAATSNVEDASVNSLINISATSLTSGSLTTASSSDILIYAVGVGTNVTGWTAGASYTIPSNNDATGASGSNARLAMQYQIVSATQSGVTTSMSFSSVGSAASVFAAFRVAGGPTRSRFIGFGIGR